MQKINLSPKTQERIKETIKQNKYPIKTDNFGWVSEEERAKYSFIRRDKGIPVHSVEYEVQEEAFKRKPGGGKAYKTVQWVKKTILMEDDEYIDWRFNRGDSTSGYDKKIRFLGEMRKLRDLDTKDDITGLTNNQFFNKIYQRSKAISKSEELNRMSSGKFLEN